MPQYETQNEAISSSPNGDRSFGGVSGMHKFLQRSNRLHGERLNKFKRHLKKAAIVNYVEPVMNLSSTLSSYRAHGLEEALSNFLKNHC